MLSLFAACSPAVRDAGPPGAAGAKTQGRLVADLDRWPFGADEKPWSVGPNGASRIRLLRREVAKGFPVPKSWRDILAAAPVGLDRLRAVNGLVNSRPYHADHNDEWRPPAVFLAEGGDCDCFAVAKYVLLRHLGVAARDLRVAAVQRRKEKDLHVIVVARTGIGRFEIFVLDNPQSYPRTAIYMNAYIPLLSLNEEGAWIHDPSGAVIASRILNPAKP